MSSGCWPQHCYCWPRLTRMANETAQAGLSCFSTRDVRGKCGVRGCLAEWKCAAVRRCVAIPDWLLQYVANFVTHPSQHISLATHSSHTSFVLYGQKSSSAESFPSELCWLWRGIWSDSTDSLQIHPSLRILATSLVETALRYLRRVLDSLKMRSER